MPNETTSLAERRQRWRTNKSKPRDRAETVFSPRNDGWLSDWFLPLATQRRQMALWPAWARMGLAAVLGVIATAALPPLYLWPCLFVAFTGLALLIDAGSGVKSAAWTGWWFGFGHFTSGLYWVALALYTDAQEYGTVAPLAPIALGAGMAIYPAFAAALARLLAKWRIFAPPAGRVLALAIAWGIGEWLRGHLFTGFPWNLIAYSWGGVPAMMQSAAIIGSYGLGVVTVAIAAAPATLAAARRPSVGTLMPVMVAAAGLALFWVGGAARLSAAGPPGSLPMTPGVGLKIVQPNIAEDVKWREDLRLAHLSRLLNLSKAPGPNDKVVDILPRGQRVTDVIWPETAVPFLVDQDESVRAIIAGIAPRGGLLITGAPRATRPGQVPFRVWNSVVAVNDTADVVGVYDKFHLVPFGEYLPLRNVLPKWLPLQKLTPGTMDFSRGPGPRTLLLPGLPPVGPLICYEIIFPGDVLDRDDPPSWLLNVTNDGWFGISSGPYQHFMAARMRAVEEGIPVVRAANTGISGIIDPYGRVLARLQLGTGGFIDGPLPKPLPRETAFSQMGDGALVVVIIATILLASFAARRRPGDEGRI